MADDEMVKLIVDLPLEDIQRLEKLAKSINSNRVTALVRSIRLLRILYAAEERGGRIEIIQKNGDVSELRL